MFLGAIAPAGAPPGAAPKAPPGVTAPVAGAAAASRGAPSLGACTGCRAGAAATEGPAVRSVFLLKYTNCLPPGASSTICVPVMLATVNSPNLCPSLNWAKALSDGRLSANRVPNFTVARFTGPTITTPYSCRSLSATGTGGGGGGGGGAGGTRSGHTLRWLSKTLDISSDGARAAGAALPGARTAVAAPPCAAGTARGAMFELPGAAAGETTGAAEPSAKAGIALLTTAKANTAQQPIPEKLEFMLFPIASKLPNQRRDHCALARKRPGCGGDHMCRKCSSGGHKLAQIRNVPRLPWVQPRACHGLAERSRG